MNRDFATVIFGLAASLCWGSGDFSGGLASRRANASSVVIAAYAVGFVLLVALALLWKEPFPSPVDIVWGGLAGLAGVIGLISFYSALSIGRMGIVAPVSAVLTAALPVLFSVGLISRPERARGRPKGNGLALLAGCGFGCFFILISHASHAATFWPLAVARFTSVLFMLVVVRIRQQQMLPKMTIAPIVLLAGVLDAIGNVFFVLATHTGRLDVAAVLSSLYPAATVLLD